MPRASRPLIHLGLALLAVAALIWASAFWPPAPGFSLPIFLLAAGLVALCSGFRIHLTWADVHLAHAVGLVVLFTFGPAPAGWSLLAGLLVSELARAAAPARRGARASSWSARGVRFLSDTARQLLPLLAASGLYLGMGGRFPLPPAAGEAWAALGAFVIVYLALYNLLLILAVDARPPLTGGTLLQLGALQVLPLPAAVFAAYAHDLVGPSLFFVLGGLLVVIAASLHMLTRTQTRLRQKIEENARRYAETQRQTEELARLLDASSNLSATLNTEDALSLICPSAMRIVGAPGAALFLLDTRRAELVLAHAQGLSADFVEACRVVPITDDARGSHLITAGPPRLVADLDDLAQGAPAAWVEHMRAEGLRAFVSLPLLARGEPLGAVVAFFQQPPDIPPWTTEVLRAFGNQAALTIANTRLYEQTEEALARRVRRLAALSSISHEVSATLDPQPLFDTIIARAVDATHASLGKLGLTDAGGGRLHVVAGHGLPPAELEADKKTAWPVDQDGGVVGRVLRNGKAILIDDIRSEPGPGDNHAHAETRSQLCVPILREQRRLGVILLESGEVAAFNGEDREFVEQLAVQAAIAIDNSRLYSEVHARLREQSILYEAGLTLTSSLDRRAIHTALAQKLAQVVAADECVLLDFDPASGMVQPVWQWSAPGRAPRNTAQAHAVKHLPVTARVLNDRALQLVRVDDPEADPDVAERLRVRGFSVLLALPMIAVDQAVGVVELYCDQPREFAQNEVHLAQTLANQAAIAMENARLFHRVMEGRDRLVAVLNSTREGVLVIDATGQVLLVNPRLEELWGVAARRLYGQNLVSLLEARDLNITDMLGFQAEEIHELLQTLRAGLALSIPQVQYELGGARPRFVERSGAPVLDQLGKAIGWVITLRDVTDEREVQEMREALANMIVHDLRSPLTAVLASLTLVRDRIPQEHQTPVIRQALEVANRSSKKLLGLVNNLLDVSRMESGEVTLQRTSVGLHALVDEVIADLTPLASEHGIFLINDVPPDLPPLLVDRDKVGRVFTNLIDNALKFTPAGGRVWLSAEPAASAPEPQGAPMIQCAVMDTGPGIPEDYRDKIFDRFVQVYGRRGRRQGTGLGLAFCKLTVEAHGGKIWAENRDEGGSAFYFLLPTGVGSPHFFTPSRSSD